MGNEQRRKTSGSQDGDHEESSGVKTIRVEKGKAKQTTGGNELAGGTINANEGDPRSVGSLFAILEADEELEGDEMETEEWEEVRAAAKAKKVRVELVGAVGKRKKAESDKANGLEEVVVLKASHPGLVEGSKTVQLNAKP